MYVSINRLITLFVQLDINNNTDTVKQSSEQKRQATENARTIVQEKYRLHFREYELLKHLQQHAVNV